MSNAVTFEFSKRLHLSTTTTELCIIVGDIQKAVKAKYGVSFDPSYSYKEMAYMTEAVDPSFAALFFLADSIWMNIEAGVRK